MKHKWLHRLIKTGASAVWLHRLIRIGVIAVLVLLAVLLAPHVLRVYHASRAEAALNENRPADATSHLEWLYALAPEDIELCLKLTDAYLGAGNHARAEYTLICGIGAEASQLSLYLKLCAVYLAQDKLFDAVSFLDGIPNPLIRDQIEALRPDPPAFFPVPGRYEEVIQVGLTLPEGADGYLSIDGRTPLLAEDLFETPLALPVGMSEAMAVSVRNGLPSRWAWGEYRLENIVQPMDFKDYSVERLLRELLDNEDGAVMSSDLWAITRLTPDTESMRYMSLADLPHLRDLAELSLYGDGSKVDISPLAGMTHLKSLSLRQFALDDADLEMIAGWAWLEELSLQDNRFVEIDALSDMDSLTALNLAGNSIQDASPLSDLVGLTRLDLSRNVLANSAPLATLGALRELNLSGNKLRGVVGLRTLTQLVTLDISFNEISDLGPLSAHTNLVQLLCKECPVSSLGPLENCRSLEVLSVTGGEIQSVSPLSSLRYLRELCLDENKLTSLSGLEDCKALATLRVSYNQIGSLEPLTGLSVLAEVAVEGNRIASLAALRGCPALMEVYVYDNPLEEGEDTLGAHVTVHRNRMF
ncbi:MAG: leucine-rich repeat domain-containing protein [Oscillospiraceae bacterium]|nr:leucine-rich repeat domain-containing protein [Oscillospiraceae bacterium]